jgi:glycosyltransferase involved in cell wall biosynthesis
MRVIIASRIYLPEPSAASFRLDALARALVEAGHDVTVLTAAGAGDRGFVPPASVRVRRMPVLRDRDGYVRGYLQYLSFDVPLAFRLLFRRADLVIAEPPPTTGAVVRVVAMLRRIPYAYYAADIWSDAADSIGVTSFTVRALRRIEKTVLRRAAVVLTVNPAVTARVGELEPGARVVEVGNGVDTDVFSATPDPDADAQVDLVEAEGPFAVYAGTTSEWQGADVFVRAMPDVLRESPAARIVFLGQGTARAELARLADQLGVADAVELRDRVPARIAAAWLRAARFSLVSLQPGQGYDIALPTKVLASLACGTRVLFAGVGPTRELMARAGAAGVDPGRAVDYDLEEVAAAMRELFAEPHPEAPRRALAGWAEANVSLREAAGRAVREAIP